MVVHATPPSVVHATPELTCLDFSGKTKYNDFRDDLVRDGYAVVKGVLSPEKAYGYTLQDIHQWLEEFGLGYKRDEPSTIREECLPIIHQKGLVQAYGAPHEVTFPSPRASTGPDSDQIADVDLDLAQSFTWAVRSEPNVIGAFEKLFDTEDLLVSFDAVNVSLPNRRDLPEVKPWPHQDQDPERPGFRCVQGFVNLNPCGQNDGGLMVLKGGHLVSKEYHDQFREEEREFRWTNEMYLFKDTGLAWLKELGLEWVKVNCEPGDLVLWDSRAPHYNVAPKGETARFVVYTCYAPVHTATKEDLLQKKQLFETTKGHSHWPQGFQPFIEHFVAPKRNGENDPLNTWAPRKKPVLSERAFKLTGIPYIETMSA
ncbi:BQ5605_C013g07350 [Microbotryum silenes-dioicae]|uniref:BQ5605_C013g07350 protein n=1 Tax=Microbotryum silenes-dioicae TaxID=796604 RepID=A0A2X0LV65_9BASI|nr:BQ5605_C013g07350 [Microbotryum silenes-dioicae]